MDPTAVGTTEEVTRDERTMAMLAHVLTIFAGFIGAGIIYLIKRKDSRFVAFHALQVLLWHALLFVLFFVALFIGFIAFATFVFASAKFPPVPPPGSAAQGGPPFAFLAGFFGVWLVGMLSWLANLVTCIYLGVRASEGKWARYPFVGSLALRLV